MTYSPQISAGGRLFSVTAGDTCIDVAIRLCVQEPALQVFHVVCLFAGRSCPVTLGWTEEMLGIHSTLVHTTRRSRQVQQWYAPTRVAASFHKGAPLLSVVHMGCENFATVALSDAVWDTELTYAVDDFAQQEQVAFSAAIACQPRAIDRYETYLRIDRRPLPVTQTVADTGAWWRSFYPPLRPTPPHALMPTYSSWYNFHQHPSAQALLQELPLAAELGFRTLIIDDGWQYDGNGTGDYFDCGNWQPSPEKFPDLAGFVQEAHRQGIAVMLWFPMPFVGRNTQAYQEFSDRLLEDSDAFRAGILDPRYPSVRQYLIDLYSRYLAQYDLDGLKLDFIDSFKTTEATPPATGEMDELFVEAAVERLLQELDAALHALKDSVLIEYRQNYIGPAIVRYGNMLRVGDCPFDLVNNRTAVADLRMLGYDAAIHADMLYWHRRESVENCGLQLLHILFSVPQISILLQDAPLPQREAIGAFLRYWTDNRQTLLQGQLSGSHCEAFYDALRATLGDRSIEVRFVGALCSYTGGTADFHNATEHPFLVVDNASSLPKAYTVYDCLGKPLARGTLSPGCTKVAVPTAGRLCLS